MITISKPFSAQQARTYHKQEFTASDYWSRGPEVWSEWQGKLAHEWELEGPVQAEVFARLSEGQHPYTGEQLVQHQARREYLNAQGRVVKSVEHRSGWDATISAPKSVSITALVGGDQRVLAAHRESVRVALEELERYTQARIGNVHIPETTGKFIAATFEHTTARPVKGYAAPQVHTHALIFNVTVQENKKARSLQPQELFASQQYVTAVYRSSLALRLECLGYAIERGEYGQPEIIGYTKPYLEAASPRRDQILEHLASHGFSGAAAAQIAALRTREGKQVLSSEEVLARHREMAESYGNQAESVVAEARRSQEKHLSVPSDEDRMKHAQEAVTYARDHCFERSAVQDERSLLRAALDRAMGYADCEDVRQVFEKRAAKREFQRIEEEAEIWTTREMLSLERENIVYMLDGQSRCLELVPADARAAVLDRHSHLSESQHQAVSQILMNRDRIIALQGVAGAGKTTTLSALREAAEIVGYRVEGFAPTSRAAQKMAESGMETSTLQRHLERGRRQDSGERRLYVLDESSMASTRQLHAFFRGLHQEDRILLVGDTRQHESIEAGRPFAQLKEAGMQTARLEEIVRQRDPELKSVVEQLVRGQVGTAVQNLDRQGRVHEVAGREERIAAITNEYLRSPEETLIVSPDNRSRTSINQCVRRELQERGRVARDEYSIEVLVPRQEMTGANRSWAEKYEVGNIVYYSRTSRETGIARGEYALVSAVSREENLLTVTRSNDQVTTYDPRRQSGVSVYREDTKLFATGDLIQFTAPSQTLKVANREFAMVESISPETIRLSLENGRTVAVSRKQHCHIDHGYAVTSHSSQGQTAGRVLVHVETEQVHRDLLNSRMAYVSVSRGQWDAQIFTNDKEKLAGALGHEVSQQSAHSLDPELAVQQDSGMEQGNNRFSRGVRR